MANNIKFNSDKVRNVATSTKSRVEKINEDLKKMKQLIESVQSVWQGKDSDAYITRLTENSANIETLVKTLEELPTALTKIANDMDQVTQSNVSATNI